MAGPVLEGLGSHIGADLEQQDQEEEDIPGGIHGPEHDVNQEGRGDADREEDPEDAEG